jgi:hypothetical protein
MLNKIKEYMDSIERVMHDDSLCEQLKIWHIDGIVSKMRDDLVEYQENNG